MREHGNLKVTYQVASLEVKHDVVRLVLATRRKVDELLPCVFCEKHTCDHREQVERLIKRTKNFVAFGLENQKETTYIFLCNKVEVF